MAARLKVLKGVNPGAVFTLKSDNTLGSREDNSIVLQEKGVSRSHARIYEEQGKYHLVDLGSRNGVLVNGHAVTSQPLKAGDRVQLGEGVFVFEEDETRSEPQAIVSPEVTSKITARTAPGEMTAVFTCKTAEELKKRHERFRILYEIGQTIGAISNLDKVLSKILEAAMSATGADRGVILLKDEKHDTLTPHAVRLRGRRSQEFVTISDTIMREALDKQEALLSIDALRDARFKNAPSVQIEKIHSAMCAPLLVKGRVLGVMHLDTSTKTKIFSQDDLELFTGIANQSALAIDNAQLYEANLAQQSRIELLNKKLEAQLEKQSQELVTVKDHLKKSQRELELKFKYDNIIGRSRCMQDCFALLDKITETNAPLLVQGESGTGKDLVAKAVHYNGARRKYRFISENCAAIPDTLLEGELFGYKKGAFTGADRDKKGLFELAHHGTLFLDEVGDMSIEMQKKLLRVLQEGEIRPVGGSQYISVDVRIISASNKDLRNLVREGEFREDLYYRLNVVTIYLPPLRERKEDLPLLIEHFLKRSQDEAASTPKRLSKKAMEMFLQYDWPGNVRELENEINRLFTLGDDLISDEILSPAIRTGKASQPRIIDGTPVPLDQVLREVEKERIMSALNFTGGNKTKAAELLGLNRRSLHRRLNELGIR